MISNDVVFFFETAIFSFCLTELLFLSYSWLDQLLQYFCG